jgi:hypothetical protein
MPRIRDIERHLASIQSAEPNIGPPQLDIIREIIYLRRWIDSVEHMARLRQLLNDRGEELLRPLSTRWLVSIADTFADHGVHPERGNAMAIVMLANITRMAETERLYLKDPSVDQARQDECVIPDTPLWDGMVGYAIKHGDMPINMWTRIRALMVETPTLSFIFETVLARLAANDTLIGRLAALNPNFCQLNDPFPYWELVG